MPFVLLEENVSMTMCYISIKKQIVRESRTMYCKFYINVGDVLHLLEYSKPCGPFTEHLVT